MTDGTSLGAFLKKGRGLFLDFDSRKSLEALVSRWGNRITYVGGYVKNRLGISAVLVRFDGFVAWVGETGLNDEGASQAASRWFGKPEELEGAAGAAGVRAS